VSTIGVNYVGHSRFVVKQKEKKALWKMAREMKSISAELAPQEGM